MEERDGKVIFDSVEEYEEILNWQFYAGKAASMEELLPQLKAKVGEMFVDRKDDLAKFLRDFVCSLIEKLALEYRKKQDSSRIEWEKNII